MFRLHFQCGHDCCGAAVDRKLKLNRIVWRQWIRHPTTYAHRVCLRYLSAYRRIEILKSSYTQNETKNQYFQQRFEQYSSNKTSDSFWSWFFDDFVH